MPTHLKKVLFVSDMDGTLLTRNKKVSLENLAAIEEFRRCGGIFSVASGRSVPSFRHYIDELEINTPVILYNGAAVYDFTQERFLWHVTLAERSHFYLEDIYRNFPGVAIEILFEDMIYVLHYNKYCEQHLTTEHLEFRKIRLEDLKKLPSDWIKVLFALPSEEMDEFSHYLTDPKYTDVSFVRSDKHYYEMLPAGSSKGNALEHLAKLLNVPMERTVGIGDFYNDIGLIRDAGTGVAVANAPADIRDMADLVVAHHEEHGVAEALRYTMDKFGCY